MTDEQIEEQAKDFARKNKVAIARELTDIATFKPDPAPVSVFMAGSPGAGKTEFSKFLVDFFGQVRKQQQVVRIDSDDLRERFSGYTGQNSRLFQGAVSLIVEKMHDLVLHNGQNFVLDGTLSDFDKAQENITRSLDKGRNVYVFYLYQKPEVAWRFTQARELVEGRNIPKEAFIQQFLSARTTISKLKRSFDDRIALFVVKKNFETNKVEDIKFIAMPEDIDDLLKERYSEDTLKDLL